MSWRRLLAIAPAWPLAAALLDPPTPLAAKGLIVATAAISTWDPAEGLLLVAGLAPLGVLLGNELDIPLRVAEALVLAFLTGWLARGRFADRGPRLPAAIAAAGALFGWIVVLSSTTQAAVLAHAHNLAPTLGLLEWAYLYVLDPIGAVEAAKVIEGLALTAAVIDLVRRRPELAERVPAALAASAVVAAAASFLLWARLAPSEILAQYGQIDYRVTAHVADVNAAGSFFALILCLAIGCAAGRAGRASWWFAAIAAAGVGLWLTTSRSAIWMLVVVIGLGGGVAVLRHWRPRQRVLAITALAVVLAAAGVWRLKHLRDIGYSGGTMRAQFAATSVRMLAERPAFGVGIGQYFPTSRLFLPAELAWTYGTENAHNYFLQIAAETGLAGGLLFVAFVGGAVWRGWRGVASNARDYRLMGLLAGVLAFLGTCLTGHPLLVTEVAVPFWIALGLLAVLGGSNVSRSATVTARRRPFVTSGVVAATAAALAATVPWRAARPHMSPPRSFVVTGRFPAEFGPDRNIVQWTARTSSLFVPDALAMVELPVRAPADASRGGLLGIEIATGGGGKDRVLVPEYWAYPLIDLRGVPAVGGLKRIDIRSDRLARLPDGREVGVGMGTPKAFTVP